MSSAPLSGVFTTTATAGDTDLGEVRVMLARPWNERDPDAEPWWGLVEFRTRFDRPDPLLERRPLITLDDALMCSGAEFLILLLDYQPGGIRALVVET
jgi:hypothetical protein